MNLEKSFDPKIYKICLVEFIDFNGAVFVNFWVFPSTFFKKTDFKWSCRQICRKKCFFTSGLVVLVEKINQWFFDFTFRGAAPDCQQFLQRRFSADYLSHEMVTFHGSMNGKTNQKMWRQIVILVEYGLCLLVDKVFSQKAEYL